MPIAALPEILTWSEPTDVLAHAHKDYVSLLIGQLGAALARIAQRDSKLGTQLLAEIQGLPDAALMRLLLAPRTCNHLLWPERHSPETTAQFLSGAARAERANLDPATAPKEEVWSALGDVRCCPAEGVQRAPRPEGLMPLDFESPFVQIIAAAASTAAALPAPPRFKTEERHTILQQFTETAVQLRSTSEVTFSFVVAYNKVVVLHKTAGTERFLTRSPEKYIGLAVFRNPQRENVDPVDLAEGLVHEGIHTVLDIDEYSRQRGGASLGQWIRDVRLYDGATRTRSPWTGAALPVHTYLHACFVWYGLLHFWALALSKGAFDRARVQERIIAAASGFLRQQVLDEVAPYRDVIAPDLLDAVERMQAHVRQAFG